MKKLLLFALLSSVSAFGQAYSDSVTQNSPGNYGRPVPYASVQICNIADTATPCTQKVNTFTDDNLSVACTQSAGSGVLTGAPVSGANCNNPGIADANGNFTIYVVPGQYRICTYANNWLCQNVSIGGTGGGIPFACASAVNGSIVGMTSTTTSSCDPNGVTDFIGHWTSQSYHAVGNFNGIVEVTGGKADPTFAPDANSISYLAPVAVPVPYYWRPPASIGTVGQCWGLGTQDVGTNGTINGMTWQNCGTGTGSVLSVGLAVPAGFPVSGSPVTTSGTLTFTMPASWATGDLLVGNGANSVARLGIGTNGFCLVSNGTTANWAACSSPIRTCMILVGADNGAVLANADIAPQLEQCQLNASATVLEVDVTADSGTPNVVVAKRHCTANPCASNFTVTDLVSSALATAASGGPGCSKTSGSAGLDTFTTCSATLQNTSLAAGDYLETHSATAGGTAHRMTIAIHYQ